MVGKMLKRAKGRDAKQFFGKKNNNKEIKADFVITSFKEILEILKKNSNL